MPGLFESMRPALSSPVPLTIVAAAANPDVTCGADDIDERKRAGERRAAIVPMLETVGMSPFELAKKAGIDRHSFYDYWNGITKKLRIGQKTKLAAVLKLDQSALPD